MEFEGLVYETINALAYAVVIFEKDKAEDWKASYLNHEMQRLLESSSGHSLQKSDTKENPEGDNPFLKLLLQYEKTSQKETSSLYDIEIFTSFYNVHFHKKENRLFAFFIEIPLESLFVNFPFHDFHDACNAVVVVLDAKGELVDANESFCKLVGMEKESLARKNFFQSFIPGDLKKLQKYLEGIYKQDEFHQHFVTSLKGAQDKNYRINWQVSRIQWHDQIYIVAVGSDVSKLMNENNELKKQLTSVQVGFDYFPFGIAYMNVEGDFTKMNSRFMHMFNIKEESRTINFDHISLFKEHIGFEKLNEYIKHVREMSYKIDYTHKDKRIKLKVDIRLLSGHKESSKFYIVVVQQLK